MKLEKESSHKKVEFTQEELAKMSPLGRRLWALRADVVAAGIPLLTWEQLDCEIEERRGRENEPS